MKIKFIEADYNDPAHGRDLLYLLDIYARDPMGGGAPLADDVKSTLIGKLADRSDAFSVLAYVDEKPAALANCFEGFSTFKAKPVVNIHDFVVHPDFRGHGLSAQLMSKVEDVAKARGACKLTLEVLTGNKVAMAAYRKYGFSDYELDPEAGTAVFWEKVITED